MAYTFAIGAFYAGLHSVFQLCIFGAFLTFRFRPVNKFFLITILVIISCSIFGTSTNSTSFSFNVFIRDIIYLCIIPLSCLLDDQTKSCITQAVLRVAKFHSFLIIILSACVSYIYFSNFNNYLAIRAFFLVNGIGDVWTSGSGFIRVQILGNPLVFISALANLYYAMQRKQAVSLLLGLGVFVAGNLTFVIIYILVCFLCFLYFVYNSDFRVRMIHLIFAFFALFSLILIALPGLDFFISKFDGESSSMGHRGQLLEFFNSYFSFATSVIGHGLGYRFLTPDGLYVNYIELQTLLLILKFGLFSYIVWSCMIITGFHRSRFNYLFYFAYLLGSSTNPYIFDNNHLLAVILFSSMNSIKFSGDRFA